MSELNALMTQGHIFQVFCAETILNQNKIVLLLPINISVAVTILQTNWVMLRGRLAVCCNWFAEITQNQNRMRFGLCFKQFQFCVAECIL